MTHAKYGKQIKIIRIPAYTVDGVPTCSIYAGKETTCPMLGFKNFGTQPVCMLGEQVDLQRVFNIVPHDKCMVHYEQ
ncbi:MAG: hypothetical protein WC449_05730 [Candidatus Paceibacterota bacterium]